MKRLRLRLLVVDDHEVVRSGVRTLLETQPGWRVCGEAADGEEAVERATRLRPDVVVLDASLPLLDGIEAARRILAALPRSEIVILTLHESPQLVREALAAGARACVFKSDAGRDLLSAVRAVARHRRFLSAGASARAGSPLGRPLLTPREREVLRLIAEGKCNRGIASVLGIRPKTVDAHRTNLMRKLDLHTVSALVRYAVREGLIQP